MPPRLSLVDQIQIAPELQREAHGGQTVAPPPDNGLSDALSGKTGLAAQFAHVGNEIGALADHAAQVEGTREGHLAGMDPEWRARNDYAMRGEAFDRAAHDTALSR